MFCILSFAAMTPKPVQGFFSPYYIHTICTFERCTYAPRIFVYCVNPNDLKLATSDSMFSKLKLLSGGRFRLWGHNYNFPGVPQVGPEATSR